VKKFRVLQCDHLSSNRSFIGTALILGLVSAIGPFAIDMYLPALPTIGRSLQASPGAVQASLTAFFVALGVCQLFYGPLSDIVGRKTPIYFGLAVFGLGSIGCALAPNIHVLIAFRVVEAVGACAGSVVPRAIVRDLHTGADATRLMSLLILVFSVSPILAPLVGSFVIALAGWRGVFWVVTGAAALGVVLTATQLRETRPPAARALSSWSGALAGYRLLLKDRRFMGLILAGAFGISAFFVYLANSSFVLIGHYGLSPAAYSLFFAMNAAAFIGAAQLNGWLTGRYGLSMVIRVAVSGFALAMSALVVLTTIGIDRLDVMAALLFVGYGFLGMVVPTASVLALEQHGSIAGTASALMGAVQMIVGASVMAGAGTFANGTAAPMIRCIAAAAVTAFLLAQLTLRAAPRAPVTRSETAP
jgi:DHA1 family bicyclomycin/chloramphenicol resistance-like MFS transporter